jgi:hypothetical protein
MHEEMAKFISGKLFQCPSDESTPPLSALGPDWRQQPDGFPSYELNYTSYWIFMGTADFPGGFPLDPTTGDYDYSDWPPVYGGQLNLNHACVFTNNPRVHVAKLSEVRSPRMVLMMDRHWAKGYYNGYYHDNANSTTTSNHTSGQTVPTYLNRELALAAGANALLADGSVRWMNMDGGAGLVKYDQDYYHFFYVEGDLAPSWQ